MIFIAHDLAVVKNISDRVCVMYLGKICEVAPPDDLYRAPAHPYTDLLLKSIPVPDPTVKPDPEGRIAGELPSPVFPPSGCRFRTRCPRAADRCAAEEPLIRDLGDGHFVACHYPIGYPEAPPTAVAETVPVARNGRRGADQRRRAGELKRSEREGQWHKRCGCALGSPERPDESRSSTRPSSCSKDATRTT